MANEEKCDHDNMTIISYSSGLWSMDGGRDDAQAIPFTLGYCSNCGKRGIAYLEEFSEI